MNVSRETMNPKTFFYGQYMIADRSLEPTPFIWGKEKFVYLSKGML